VWLHGDAQGAPVPNAAVTSRARPVGLVSAQDPSVPIAASPGAAVAAFCGIARPERFLATLREAGVQVVASWSRADDRVFSAAELLEAARVAQVRGATALVCTEKDAVRLPRVALPLPVWALRVELEMLSGSDLIDKLLGEMAAPRSVPGASPPS